VKCFGKTNRGNVSASSRVTENPSCARQAAEYEPDGPPPITRIDVDEG